MTAGGGARQRWANRHTLIMVLCCVIPLAILGILWAAGVSSSYLIFGVLWLCPLLHVFMMRGMRKDSRDDHDHVH